MSEKPSIGNTLNRVARSAGIGLLATAVDLAVLALLVEVAGLTPAWANGPALLAGAVVQFIGCRYLVFSASAGSLKKQLLGFGVTEAATLALNAVAFHLLVTLTPVPYPLARPIGTFLVFVGFSFPMWSLVFRPQARAEA